MARMVVGSSGFDMENWDLSDLANGTMTLDSATEVDVTGAGGHILYKILGTGFTTFDAYGFPTSGTASGFSQINVGGRAPMQITGMALSAATFTSALTSADYSGLIGTIFSGGDTFVGQKHDDVFTGLGGNDAFNLTRGGNDTALGGDGDDSVSFGTAFTAADSVDGGTGTDKVTLIGDYSTDVVFGTATMINVETLRLGKGFDYNLTLNTTTVASGAALAVSASGLASSNSLRLDASAVAGSVAVTGGAGADTLIGGSGDDSLRGQNGDNIFDLTHGGDDNALGGTGNDTFNVGAALTRADTIDGGTGDDTIVLDGDYATATALDIHQFSHIDHVVFAAGHDYDIHLNLNDTHNDRHTIQTVDASALGAADHFTFIANGPPNPGDTCTITGGAGDDTVNVQSGWHTIVDNTHGGNDKVTGSAQGQTDVLFGATFTADDIVRGDHFTTISLAGDYSAGIVLNGSHVSDLALIYLQTGFDYNVTLQGDVGGGNSGGMEIGSLGTAVAGHTMTIDASALTTQTDFGIVGFDSFHIKGSNGGGNYVLTSTAASSLIGGSGSDNISWSGFASGDSVDGGGGADVLGITFNGTLTSSMIQNVPGLNLNNSNVTLDDSLIAAGKQIAIAAMGTSTVDGSAETDGTIAFTAEGNNTLIGGSGDDSVYQSTGTLTFTGGGGSDTITMSPFFPASGTLVYHAASESTGVNFDVVNFFNVNHNVFDMPKAVTGIDATVSSGALTTANFDSDLAAAVNAAHLAAHHAVEFTPTTGDYDGYTFLIVDLNGHAGYQAGLDVVLTINANGALSTANFT